MQFCWQSDWIITITSSDQKFVLMELKIQGKPTARILSLCLHSHFILSDFLLRRIQCILLQDVKNVDLLRLGSMVVTVSFPNKSYKVSMEVKSIAF